MVVMGLGIPFVLAALLIGATNAAAAPPRQGVAPTRELAARDIAVSSSAQLTQALAGARPGDVITLADGVYTTDGQRSPVPIGGTRYYGTFVVSKSGTATAPIVLRGTRNAVIDGDPGQNGTSSQYGLYLVAADHVRISGLTVRNVSKGIVLDESDHSTLYRVAVHDVGDEGIHLRAHSSDNVVQGNVVSRTGRRSAAYGEGIYVGSANSNWDTYSGGARDASDRNRVLFNLITATTAESVDVKEGTRYGVLRGNRFDGAAMTGSYADSWVDLKGNRWWVRGNSGTNAVQDGFQVHQALPGWGDANVFSANTADVAGPGYGFWQQSGVTGNVVGCGNVVRRAASGFSNRPCQS